LFLKKILKIDPVYRISEFLDFHLNFFRQNHDDYVLFLTHIRHEILPMIQSLNHYKPFKEIIINWLEKNEKMNHPIKSKT